MVVDPLIVFKEPLNVWAPVPALKVPLTVRFPPKVTAAFPELFQVPLASTATSPLKLFVPVVEMIVAVPPLFTVVAPDTTRPLSTVKLPDTLNEAQDCAAPSPVTESPDGIVTVSFAPGIWAGDQFAAVFQLPLVTLNEIAVP